MDDQNLPNAIGNLQINPQQPPQPNPPQQPNDPPVNPQQQPANPPQPQVNQQNLQPEPIVHQLRIITHELSSQGVHTLISSFDGSDPKNFRSWIKEVSKYGVLVNADDDRLKRLLFGTSKGVVSSFIERFLREREAATSRELIRELQARFSDITDEQSALVLFKKLLQGKNETIQSFYERIIELAEQAFIGADLTQAPYQTQLIMCFTDGLRDNRIARQVIRARPRDLNAALNAATSELQLLKQLDARGKSEQLPYTPSSRHIEPMEIGVTVASHRYKPRPPFQGYCYNCGIRGHIARKCKNVTPSPNFYHRQQGFHRQQSQNRFHMHGSQRQQPRDFTNRSAPLNNNNNRPRPLNN